jgi:serine/threonine protein phosphatase 1
VIELLLTGRPHGYERRYLRGNHEQSMLAFLDEPILNKGWLLQGGAETLLSYGVHPPSPVSASEEELAAAAQMLGEQLPRAHYAFLAGLERYVTFGDYAFVHAGVDDTRLLDQQTDESLYWSRAAFISSKRPFSHRVVHGHTPVEQPFVDERRVAVDTGAYASGTLTAARFEGETVSFLAATRRAGPAARARTAAALAHSS